MVAPMFITFSLHWLFCYLFLCDLRHIYHLPINLTVVRIKVIKVIKLMQGYLMCAHPAKSRTQHCQCLLLCLRMLCLCCGICRLWLKSGTWKYHGCTARNKKLFFCSQRYESFPSPKTAYSYLLKLFSM